MPVSQVVPTIPPVTGSPVKVADGGRRRKRAAKLVRPVKGALAVVVPVSSGTVRGLAGRTFRPTKPRRSQPRLLGVRIAPRGRHTLAALRVDASLRLEREDAPDAQVLVPLLAASFAYLSVASRQVQEGVLLPFPARVLQGRASGTPATRPSTQTVAVPCEVLRRLRHVPSVRGQTLPLTAFASQAATVALLSRAVRALGAALVTLRPL